MGTINSYVNRETREQEDLELGGFHGDGDADEENASHGDGGVALPVLGAAVGPTAHAPHLAPEVPSMLASSSSSHSRSTTQNGNLQSQIQSKPQLLKKKKSIFAQSHAQPKP